MTTLLTTPKTTLAAWTERGAGFTLLLCLAGLIAASVGFVANSL